MPIITTATVGAAFYSAGSYVSGVAATYIAPIVAAAAAKTAQLATLYIGGQMVKMNCEQATQYLKEYCDTETDTTACMATKFTEMTSCSVGALVDSVVTADVFQSMTTSFIGMFGTKQ